MRILIVVLEYLEPDWLQTLKCVQDTGLPYELVSRDGVGNMSRAYNSIVNKEADYYWFVSNVTFSPQMPFMLAMACEERGWAGIHPAMRSSDHKFQWPNGNEPKETPFIEWTAPMVNAEIFRDNLLDEMLPYYYMDLDWCHRVKPNKVGVHHGQVVEHTYLRNKQEHPIGQLRKQLRNYWTPISQRHMIHKYGKDWQQKLWPK
jgi:hypothetical protein